MLNDEQMGRILEAWDLPDTIEVRRRLTSLFAHIGPREPLKPIKSFGIAKCGTPKEPR